MKINLRGGYGSGDFELLNKEVLKKSIAPQGRNEKNIHKKLIENYDIEILVREYYDNLVECNILMPKLYKVRNSNETVKIYQQYIIGENVSKTISAMKIENYKELFKYFKIIIGYIFSLNNSYPHLRLDTNLENFIVNSEGEVLLVDIYPPINTLIINDSDFNNTNLKDLYINLDIQIIALIGYWFKPLIINGIDNKKVFENLRFEINKILCTYQMEHILLLENLIKKENSIFTQRIILINDYLSNRITFEQLKVTFSDLSISKTLKKDV